MMRTVAIGLLAALAAVAADAAATLHLAGETMGTTWSVRVARPPAGLDAEGLRRAIRERLAAVDRQMSTYRPDSEVSRFNAARTQAWFAVSPATRRVVAEALRVSRLTEGAFDPTVGPLVDLWGFGPAGGAGVIPVAAEVEAARARVGWWRVEVDGRAPALRKGRADVTLDLSAIAKGFGIDAVSEYLRERGLRDHLVEIGGELRGHGMSERGTPWMVGIELPGEAGAAAAVVRLSGGAVATSGTHRKGFDRDGARWSHVLDPRTGRPARHALVSASVLAPTAMRADALATALMVLGPDAGWRLARRERLPALLVVRSGERLRVRHTPDLAAHLVAGGG